MCWNKCILVVVLTSIIMLSGCSHSSSPVEPVIVENIRSVSDDETNSHSQLGLYHLVCNPEAGTVDVIPLRDADLHLNALKFLEPPAFLYLTIEGPPQFNGNILDVDIGLRHPFPDQDICTGFDVCGIIFTHGSVTGFNDPDIVIAGEGDTRLLNTDGYTRWWNPAEFPHGNTVFTYIDGMFGNPTDTSDFNCTLNGYKYFADGLAKDDPLTMLTPEQRGMFSAGAKNIRHYTIDLSGEPEFNYAVDACWIFPQGELPYEVPDDFPPGANRSEAWNVTVTEVTNTLYFSSSPGSGSGELKLLIDVWDHFEAASNIVHGESMAGLPLTSALTPVGGGEGFSTYELDFTGENLIQNGAAEILITVESDAAGYGNVLSDKPICAYFKHGFKINFGWARTWGGNWLDDGYGIATDGDGNIYTTGRFYVTADFDPGPGIDEHTSNGDGDIFLSKFNSAGDFQWARTWGGNTFDYGMSVAIEGNGNIYTTGYFRETVDFDPGPGIEEQTSHGSQDIFLSKFDSAGNFQWACTWGGNSTDYCFGVTTDGGGNAYITGNFEGTVDFDPGPGIEEQTSHGSRDIFLSKFDSAGNFQWVRAWGGHYMDLGNGVAIDGGGNIYIVGTFAGTVDFDPGPGVEEYSSVGWFNLFLSKFNTSGDFQWARTWKGNHSNVNGSVAIDESGNVYTAGVFEDTVDFDPGPEVDEHTSNGEEDIFLNKFDSAGNFQWVRVWGDSGYDWGIGIAIDANGNAYVTGFFMSTVDFDPGPVAEEHMSNGGLDIFLSKFNSSGSFQWVRTCGGLYSDVGYAVAIDGSSNAYVTGHYNYIVDFDPGPGVDEHTYYGHDDIFLIKFLPDGNW